MHQRCLLVHSHRCHSLLDGPKRSELGDEGVELGVALLDPGLHAAGEPLVAALEAVDEPLGAQPGAAVAEVLEPQYLNGYAVGSPSNVKVWAIRFSSTSWKQPWKPYSSPSRLVGGLPRRPV